MRGVRRVVTFCILTTVVPSFFIILPLYLRHNKYADVIYKLSESDIIQIHAGQSSFFCQKHSLEMNSSFHAFQMKGVPLFSNKTKHLSLKKSMSLKDDTLEYWGFFLLKGAVVDMHGCSKSEGARILAVKDGNILDTCEILSEKEKPFGTDFFDNNVKVVVTSKKSPDIVLLDDFDAAEKTSIEVEDDFDIVKNESEIQRLKRDLGHIPHHVFNTKVTHGGNAYNESSDASSFEIGLYNCYSEKTQWRTEIPFSTSCQNMDSLNNSVTVELTHTVPEDGYYYYIFYSDNDRVQNELHFVFDIYKPTFQFSNLSESKICLNKTYCEFPVSFMSDELVIVEVPTKDGLEFDGDDVNYLISKCHPRTAVYIVFPIAVLVFILLCAFL